MEVLEGFCTSSIANKVCILRKSLYGLRQAPRTWFKKINRFRAEQGLTHTKTDYSLFYITSNNGSSFLYFMLMTCWSLDQTVKASATSKTN